MAREYREEECGTLLHLQSLAQGETQPTQWTAGPLALQSEALAHRDLQNAATQRQYHQQPVHRPIRHMHVQQKSSHVAYPTATPWRASLA